MPMEEFVKPIVGGVAGFFGASILHTYGLSHIEQLREFPELSDLIVMGVGYFALKKQPAWRIPVIAGAGISLVDHLLTRAGVRV